MSGNPRIGGLNPDETEMHSGTIDSMPSLGLGELGSEHGVVLRDWSAQDFANIYVRFRPHLVSHARKYLRQMHQAEEVVQDAFLYLMTALPELDSELGVLRFLKWKTKMLSLDVIRSSTSGVSGSSVPLRDDLAEEMDLAASIERADDAAIIQLALAKLTPRHREALLASTDTERTHEAIAGDMGISSNAFRQLLWRARSSFRAALVGEADVAGKTISEILSIAARKASRESGKIVTGTGMAALVIGGLIFGVNPNPNGGSFDFLSGVNNSELRLLGVPQLQVEDGKSNYPEEAHVDEPPAVNIPEQPTEARFPTAESVQTAVASFPSLTTSQTSPEISVDMNPEEELFLARSEIEQALNRDAIQGLVNSSVGLSQITDHGELTAVILENKSGLVAQLFFSEDFSFDEYEIWMSFEIEGSKMVAVPKSKAYSSTLNPDTGERMITMAGTDFLVGATSGKFLNAVSDETYLSTAFIEASIVISSSGEIISYELLLKEKI